MNRFKLVLASNFNNGDFTETFLATPPLPRHLAVFLATTFNQLDEFSTVYYKVEPQNYELKVRKT